LEQVDSELLQQLNSKYFGWVYSAIAKGSWISFDGKEIRGTIDGVMGEKRGLNIVRPFIQEDKISLNGLFFDALHTQYETLTTIEASLGTYVAQVKENQKELLEDLKDHLSISKSFHNTELINKGHGRLEQRKGSFYDISGVEFNNKWKPCNLATLIVKLKVK